MRETTTIRVAPTTRAALRQLAEADGITADEELVRLLRAERQRRMGVALAARELTGEDEAWLDASATTVATHARG